MSFISFLKIVFLQPRKLQRSAPYRGSTIRRPVVRKPMVEFLEGRSCPSSLAFSTYLGGSGNDGSRAVAVDSAGDTFVAGVTQSANFPVTPGAYDTKFTGSSDGFVAKYNPSGSLVWATYLGGSGSQQVQGIAVDATGDVYVTGQTTSSDFPITPGAVQPTHAGTNYDAFVTKINATGTALVYSTYLGGSGDTYGGEAIAVDASGNAYVTGETRATDFPTTAGAFQRSLQGYQDAVVTKLNPTATALVYSTYLGSSNGYIQDGFGIALNAAGDAYITGRTDATNFPTTPGAYQTTSGSGGGFEAENAFVTELNATGSGLIYSTYLGGTSWAEGDGIALDHSGNAYVAGYTTSTNFPTTAGAFQRTLAGQANAFVAKLNPSGTGLVYSTYLGGSGVDRPGEGGNAIAVDASDHAYVTGSTTSTNFPSLNPVQSSNGGGTDAFVTELNASGTGLTFSTYLGGSGDEQTFGSASLAVGASGTIAVTGSTSSTNFPTAKPFQAANAGGYDAFLTEISGSLVVTTTSDSPSHTGVSLRDAIEAANADAAIGLSETITFAPSLNGATIVLTQGQLELTAGSGTTTFDGGNQITISGNSASSIFEIDNGASAILTGLTIENGSADLTLPPLSGPVGGGIVNFGTLTVNDSTIANNQATGGGGIFSGSPTGLIGSTLLTVSNSTFIDNSAVGGPSGGRGGAIDLNSGTAFVINSTFTGNSANGLGYGGAIANASDTLTVTNSTLSANSAGYGGGIANINPNSSILPTKLAGSGLSAPGNSGSLVGGHVAVLNTIVAGNSATSGPDLSGSFAAKYTLIGNTAGATISGGTGDILNPISVGLGSLGNYGGPTLTIPLLPGSPAINAGSNALAVDASGQPLPFDQRGLGFPRIVGSAVDMGAFEVQVPSTTVTASPGGPIVMDSGTILTSSATLTGGSNPIGTYQWASSASGDASNMGAVDRGSTAEQTVVSKASPTITTSPGAEAVSGTGADGLPRQSTAAATLANGSAETGSITFNLYDPNDIIGDHRSQAW